MATDAFGRTATEQQHVYFDTSAPEVTSLSVSDTTDIAGKIWLKSRRVYSRMLELCA